MDDEMEMEWGGKAVGEGSDLELTKKSDVATQDDFWRISA
jgi:hypothetical protein